MRSIFKQIALLGAMLALMVGFGYAQTNTITETSLAAAMSATASSLTVASATGITANNTTLMIDQEPMSVTAVSGTTITVSRTTGRKAGHVIYSRVYIGRPEWFKTYDAPDKTTCTLASEHAHPWVNAQNGKVFRCVSSVWYHENALGISGPPQVWTIPLGSVAYASLGTDTTITATTVYVAEVFIPRTMLVTGVKVLSGGTVAGTDTGIGFLFRAGGGAAVAYSTLSGTTLTSTNTVQTLAFTTPFMANGPARYWIGIQVSANTTKIRTVATSTFLELLSTSITSNTYGTVPTLTAPTTLTADVGPVAGVY